MKTSLLFLVLLGLVACNNSSKLTYIEKRLVGTWFYTNVDFNPKWGFRKDITGDYFGVELEFKNDFSFVRNDLELNLTSTGVWQVNQAIATTNNNQTSSDQVVFSYQLNSGGEITQEIWDQFCVNRNKINGTYSTKDGFYQIELKRK